MYLTKAGIIYALRLKELTAEFKDDVCHIYGRTLLPPTLDKIRECCPVVLNDKFYFKKLR